VTDQSPDPASDERGVDRRALLRRGGVIVAATVAGAAAVDGLTAGSARAASGDDLLLGSLTNDSGTDPTAVTSAATTGPTLSLANSANNGLLGFADQTFDDFAPDGAGELASLDEVLYYTFDFGPGPFGGIQPGFVYTEFVATQVQTIIPQRALDTRSGAGRARIVNSSGNIQAGTGRLLGGHTIDIDLTDYEFGATAAFCNLTAVTPTATGYMILFPGGTRPATSSINFGKSQTLANFGVTGTSATDTVSIFSSVTSHVLLDITAFCVFSPQDLNPAVVPAVATAHARTPARAKGAMPDWYRGNRGR
jgi:hypothetical protein